MRGNVQWYTVPSLESTHSRQTVLTCSDCQRKTHVILTPKGTSDEMRIIGIRLSCGHIAESVGYDCVNNRIEIRSVESVKTSSIIGWSQLDLF